MFSSERLTFSQITPSDENLSLEMSQSDEVMIYITSKGLSLSEAKERFEYQLSVNKENPKLGFIKANLKKDNAFIGYIKITPFQEGVLEIGYALLPEHWKKGYASEMLKAMTTYAISLQLFTTLLGIVDTENNSSIHVLTKEGFTLDKEFSSQGRKTAHYIKPIP